MTDSTFAQTPSAAGVTTGVAATSAAQPTPNMAQPQQTMQWAGGQVPTVTVNGMTYSAIPYPDLVQISPGVYAPANGLAGAQSAQNAAQNVQNTGVQNTVPVNDVQAGQQQINTISGGGDVQVQVNQPAPDLDQNAGTISGGGPTGGTQAVEAGAEPLVRDINLDWAGVPYDAGRFSTTTGQVEYLGLSTNQSAQLRSIGTPEELVAYIASQSVTDEQFTAVYDGLKELALQGFSLNVKSTNQDKVAAVGQANASNAQSTSGDSGATTPSAPGVTGGTSESPGATTATTGGSPMTPQWRSRFTTLIARSKDPEIRADSAKILAEIEKSVGSEDDLVRYYEQIYDELELPAAWSQSWERRFKNLLDMNPDASAIIASIKESDLSGVGLSETYERIKDAIASGELAASGQTPAIDPSTPSADNGWDADWERLFRSITIVNDQGQQLKLSPNELTQIRTQMATEAELEQTFFALAQAGPPGWNDTYATQFEAARKVNYEGRVVPLKRSEIEQLKASGMSAAALEYMLQKTAEEAALPESDRIGLGKQKKANDEQLTEAQYQAMLEQTEGFGRTMLKAQKIMGDVMGSPVLLGGFGYSIWGRNVTKAMINIGNRAGVSGMAAAGIKGTAAEVGLIRLATRTIGAGGLKAALKSGASISVVDGAVNVSFKAGTAAGVISKVKNGMLKPGFLSKFGIGNSTRAVTVAEGASGAGTVLKGATRPGLISSTLTKVGVSPKLAAGAGRWAGPAAMAAFEAYNIYSAYKDERYFGPETKAAVGGGIGGVAGALAGAKIGALAGGTIASVVPGVGTAVGAGVGGLLGGIGGYMAGSGLGKTVAGWFD